MEVCLIQTDPRRGYGNLGALASALLRFPTADLYVLPELFTIGMFGLAENAEYAAHADQANRLVEAIRQQLQDRDAAVVCGLVEKDGQNYYNTATVILGQGDHRYRQKYLARRLTTVLQIQAGNSPKTVSISRRYHVGLMVCNDYVAADSEFFPEYKKEEVSSVVLIADSIAPAQLHREFSNHCRKHGLAIVICNSAGCETDGNSKYPKGGSCILDQNGNFVPLQIIQRRVGLPYLSSDFCVAFGTLEDKG